MSTREQDRAAASIRKFIAEARNADDDFEKCELGHAHIVHAYMVTAIKFKDTDIGLDAEQAGQKRLYKLIELSSSEFNAYQSCIELIDLLAKDSIPVPKELSEWSVAALHGDIKRPHLNKKRNSGQVKQEMLVLGSMHIAQSYGFPLMSDSNISAACIAGECLFPTSKDPAAAAAQAYNRANDREDAFDG